MLKKVENTPNIFVYLIMFFALLSFFAYHGGYALGKLKAHIENQNDKED